LQPQPPPAELLPPEDASLLKCMWSSNLASTLSVCQAISGLLKYSRSQGLIVVQALQLISRVINMQRNSVDGKGDAFHGRETLLCDRMEINAGRLFLRMSDVELQY
jgi:hypothetical protein